MTKNTLGGIIGRAGCGLSSFAAKLGVPALCGLVLAASFAGVAKAAADATREAPRQRVSFDAGWRFHKGDADATAAAALLTRKAVDAALLPERAPFMADETKAPALDAGFGGSLACAAPSFDDSSWRQLDLPHDWGIEGPFDQAYDGATGKLPWWGVAWYRKHFTLPSDARGRSVYLDIDGAMSNALVWVNDRFAGGWRYGYSSFRVDMTPFLKVGGENTVAIRLDNPPHSSRWYPGGGIYRNVWLVETSPVHVAHWGTQLTTPEISADAATILLKTTVANGQTKPAAVGIKTEVYALDSEGRKVGAVLATASGAPLALPAGGDATQSATLTLPHPRLWSPAAPNRYVAVTTVLNGGEVADVYETPFGVRSIKFDANKGFLLNGQVVKIQGVCDHHDLGALGAAINTRALERQIEILKEMGCNAIRTSHNPPAPELLDLCDRLGMLVMDESFDCWAGGKNDNDYHVHWAVWHEADLRAQARRDRNHPSVILWSVGNEVREQYPGPIVRDLRRIMHEEDATRPVTVAASYSEAGFNGFQKEVDVFGYNYKPGLYAKFHKENPDVPIFASETSSTMSSRGEYFFPLSVKESDFQVNSYDLDYPGWASTPDAEFAGEDKNPFVMGEFVWTGFDYLGEPTPYNSDRTNLLNTTDPKEKARMAEELARLGKIQVPSRSSYFGVIDLCGFPKDRFYLYQSRWRPDLPMAHILPHWNWPERVGKVTPVMVYTSGDEAELFLNGVSLGRKKKGPLEYRLRWDDVKYAPGELKVVAYRHGAVWATDTVKTTGPAAQVKLSAARPTIAADGKDLSYVTVTIADKDGLMVPRSMNHVKFTISGPGEIVATDNGDATDHTSFQSHERNAFNGLALVIVRSVAGQSGAVTLTATSPGLAPARTTITCR